MMGWFIALIVGSSLLVVVAIQGVRMLSHAKASEERMFGLVTLLLACKGALVGLLFFSGVMVLSPELGIVMVQGAYGRWLLALLLLLLPTWLGFDLHVARTAAKRKPRLRMLLGLGVVIGVVSVLQLLWSLDAGAQAPLRIYTYDLWFPPLLTWGVLCGVALGLHVLRVRSIPLRSLLICFVLAAVSLRALNEPVSINPFTQPLWMLMAMVLLPFTAALAVWLLLPVAGKPAGASAVAPLGVPYSVQSAAAPLSLSVGTPSAPGCLRIAVIVLAALTSFAGAALFVVPWWSRLVDSAFAAENEWAWSITTLVGVALWMSVPGGLLVIRTLRRLLGRGASAQQQRLELPAVTPRQRLLLLAVLLIVAGLAGLFYRFASLAPAIALIFCAAGWILLSELVSDVGLRSIAAAIRSGRLPAPRALAHSTAARAITGAAGLMHWSGRALRGLFSVDSAVIAIVRLLAVGVAVVALSELPNAGKTIIRPFSVQAQGSDAALSADLADRLLPSVNLLTEDLQPAAIVPQAGLQGAGSYTYVRLAGVGGMSTVLDDGDSIVWGDLRIPANLLLTPIQTPMRALLGVRMIDGSLYESEEGYVLLASSSQSEAWRVETTERGLSVAATDLSDKLAFELIKDTPTMVEYGMTDSWPAFRAFQSGTEKLQRAAREGDLDSSTEAIADLQRAVGLDNTFALSSYRLGLALQADGQPAAATEAFRASLSVQPDFVPAMNALAYHLYYFESAYSNAAGFAASQEPQPSNPVALKVRIDEARRLWREVTLAAPDSAALHDRASAYYGLCLYALDQAGQNGVAAEDFKRHLTEAFYHCQRAQRLYNELSPEQRRAPEIKQAEAAVLNTLGVVIDKRSNLLRNLPSNGWSCYSGSYNSDGSFQPSSAYSSQRSRRYYEQASLLSPNDLVIRCNLAVARFFQGDGSLMHELAADPSMHVYLAGSYANLGRTNRELGHLYYKKSLEEYQWAIDLNENSGAALNGYAFHTWTWRYRSAAGHIAVGPSANHLAQAQRHAEHAVKLAGAQHVAATRAIYTSTLGEVLIGRGEPVEAIALLESLFQQGLVPDHSWYNEIRWDLAVAYSCQAAQEADGAYKNQLRQRAQDLFDQIRLNESEREYRPYLEQPQLLDVTKPIPACAKL
jgi:hypothetical protein